MNVGFGLRVSDIWGTANSGGVRKKMWPPNARRGGYFAERSQMDYLSVIIVMFHRA